ncbi:hypothetical protein SHI21_17205 [Bacteriovorax sp. PP10]|uniref:Uncharacterized protein n=1 Tax=Bacteriovorax antarcticus TaxID=3088717 RepID=A0ABU5VY24_9BACT|nr:hypothetical protein [Bacteriovorax sp. PP10]MEA9357973.1 hypothetical protein [Bacteriovorax sp. PP10]
MKSFLALALLAISFSSQAVVVARLTNIECVSLDGSKSIHMTFDSSKSMFGTQVFEINGQPVTSEIMKGNEYRVKTASELHVFSMKSDKDFTTSLESIDLENEVKMEYDEETGDYVNDPFVINGVKTEVDCHTETKFRLRK